jgi:hypothetical protein
MSPSSSNDHFHHTYDSSELSKDEISVMDNQQRPSLDSASRYQTPQTQLTSTTTSFFNTDDIEEESKCSSLCYINRKLSYHNVEIFSRIFI